MSLTQDTLISVRDLPGFQTIASSGMARVTESLKILCLPSLKEYVLFLVSKSRFVDSLNVLLYLWVPMFLFR